MNKIILSIFLLLANVSWAQQQGFKKLENAKYALVSESEELLSAYRYDDIQLGKDEKSSIVRVRVGTKWGVLNRNTGQELVPICYDEVDKLSNEKIAFVKNSGKWGAVDPSTRNIIIPFEYSNPLPFHNERGALLVMKNDNNQLIVNTLSGKASPPYKKLEVLGNTNAYVAQRTNEDGYRFINAVTGEENFDYSYDAYKYGVFIAVKRNDKWGAISYTDNYFRTLKEVVPCVYDEVDAMLIYTESDFKHACIACKTSKCGMFDRWGSEILPMVYDRILARDAGDIARDRNFIVKKDGMYGVANCSGEIALPLEHELIAVNGKDNFILKKNGKFGVVNLEKETSIPIVYDSLQRISRRDFYVASQNGKHGLITNSAAILVPFVYDEMVDAYGGRLFVKQGNLWGVMDEKNMLLLPFIYEAIAYHSKDIYKAKRNGKWGLINQNLEVLIPFDYDELGRHIKSSQIASVNGKKGVVSYSSKSVNTAIPFQYDSIFVTGGNELLFLAFKNGEKNLFTPEGETQKLPDYDDSFNVNSTFMAVRKGGKWGLMNKRMKSITLDYKYYEMRPYSNSLVVVEFDRKYGVLEAGSHKLAVPLKYEFISLFCDTEIEDTGLAIAKKGNKWGCLNADGTESEKIPFIYDNLEYMNYSESLFLAAKNGKYGIVNRRGKETLPFVYDKIKGRSSGSIMYFIETYKDGNIEQKYISKAENR